MNYYAGIGSRQTPDGVLALMERSARRLSQDGFILRSGGARGADSAFAAGTTPQQRVIYTANDDIPSWAFQTVDAYHPAPQRLSSYARRLHARNAMILLGADGHTPVRFILCWTPGGQITGGTGQALRIALHKGIPVFNLFYEEIRDRLNAYISQPA